uniref:Uncharacterized protein n=1 Tax=Anguilla anguilla TaxID=7936 RepID=A0A0E9SL22_ANGAN
MTGIRMLRSSQFYLRNRIVASGLGLCSFKAAHWERCY